MNYSLLIIDDEPMICQGLAVLLDWNALGFAAPVLCYSFEDAQELLQEQAFDLVISDILLHSNNSLTLVGQSREMRRRTHFILISAYAEFSFAQLAIRYNVEGYVLKPIHEDILTEYVQKVKLKLDREYRQANAAPAAAEPAFVEEGSGNGERLDADIREVILYTAAHYREELTLSALAKDRFFNASYLGQKFHSQVGLRFSDYLNLLRIHQAAKLLSESDLPVFAICEQVGYSSSTYFHRVFHKIVGCTSGEFRRLNRQGKAAVPPLPASVEQVLSGDSSP